MLSDNSLGEINPNDLEASDLLFIGGGDYQVQDDSPCIDAGINVGVSFKYDLARNGRIFGPNVDMGAYEKLYNSVKEVEQEFLSIFPNPATNFLHFQFSENTTQDAEVSLFAP